jgi:hypothetical protein
MAGSIGCAGLGVSGQGGDSVIRLTENLIETSTLGQAELLTENITESVTIVVT